MNIGKTVTYCALEGVFLCGNVPKKTVCDQCLGRRARFDVDTSHIFPQGVLAAVPLAGVGDGDGGARSSPRHEVVLPLCSVVFSTALSGAGSDSKLLEQKP